MPTKHPDLGFDICFAVPTVHPEIEKVIFNDPATIIIWDDGSKTVVKCQEGDTFDKRIGLAMAICKKFFGNKSKYNEVFKKWADDFNLLDVPAGAKAFGIPSTPEITPLEEMLSREEQRQEATGGGEKTD